MNLKNKIFNIYDARNINSQLSLDQARSWAKFANVEYERIKSTGVMSEKMIQDRAIRVANEKVKNVGTRNSL